MLAWLPIFALVGCVSGQGDAHQGTTAAQAAPVWTCPMHPDVREPGQTPCPKCKMDLVPAEVDAIVHWTCPMHPSVKESGQTPCPMCLSLIHI